MVPETDRGPDLSIEISSDLRAHVNGMPFVDAPPVSELHRELGPPARIIEAGGPAPVKHRCNQMHVHDSLGVVFNEHHYTRRLQACIVVFWTEDFDFDFAPQNAFASRLRIGGYDVSPRPELLPFLRGCPVRFEPTFKGVVPRQ